MNNHHLSPAGYEAELLKAKQFVESRDRFLVVSHVHPDGDAVSSTLAVGWLLHRLGKTFAMANADPVPRKFADLWRSGTIVRPSSTTDFARYEHIIAVDCAEYSRIGCVRDCFAENRVLLNIDHHATNDRYGDVNLVNAQSGATVEIIYDLIKKFDVQWDRDIASLIYTGLLTDTGGFRYANTSPKVFSVAAEMLNYGVEASHLAEKYLEQMSYPQFALLQRALPGLSFTPDRRIAWLTITRQDMTDTGARNEDTEGLVNYPRNIEGVEVGILFKEIAEEEIKVSLRSSGRADAALIAKSFGGGGHARAAGYSLYCRLSEAVERTIKEVGMVLR